jgi:hypothetical protein
MRFTRFLAVLAAPTFVALGASCAPLGIFGGAVLDEPGVGGSTFVPNTNTGASSGAGGSSGLDYDAGADAALPPMTPSYLSLCGGPHATCTPGATVDTCAPGGNPGMGGSATDASALSCQVVSSAGGGGGGGDAGVTAQCRMAGAGVVGAPCTTVADCGPELGCMAGLTPTCRPYCCESLESCPADTYCIQAAMAESASTQIPVCVPAQKCELLDDTTCPPGLTCAIVRDDGTTSCVTPGAGTAGESCPCAAGFTCSLSNATCLQLCSTAVAGSCGPTGLCQGGSTAFPANVGYCVSTE